MGDSKLTTLPLGRVGEVDRAEDSMLVMSLSCSVFLSAPSGACRRAVNHTANVRALGDKLILPRDVIYSERKTLPILVRKLDDKIPAAS